MHFQAPWRAHATGVPGLLCCRQAGTMTKLHDAQAQDERDMTPAAPPNSHTHGRDLRFCLRRRALADLSDKAREALELGVQVHVW